VSGHSDRPGSAGPFGPVVPASVRARGGGRLPCPPAGQVHAVAYRGPIEQTHVEGEAVDAGQHACASRG
jgi:hypothetical protein